MLLRQQLPPLSVPRTEQLEVRREKPRIKGHRHLPDFRQHFQINPVTPRILHPGLGDTSGITVNAHFHAPPPVGGQFALSVHTPRFSRFTGSQIGPPPGGLRNHVFRGKLKFDDNRNRIILHLADINRHSAIRRSSALLKTQRLIAVHPDHRLHPAIDRPQGQRKL